MGVLDFLGHMKRIRDGAQVFSGYGNPPLRTIVKKKLTVQRITVAGQPYARLVGTKTGNNHWNLKARVSLAPEALPDGTRVRLDILQGNQVIPGALGLSAVTIAGTAADAAVQPLVSGDIIRFQALIRMHLATVLTVVSSAATEIHSQLSS